MANTKFFHATLKCDFTVTIATTITDNDILINIQISDVERIKNIKKAKSIDKIKPIESIPENTNSANSSSSSETPITNNELSEEIKQQL